MLSPIVYNSLNWAVSRLSLPLYVNRAKLHFKKKINIFNFWTHINIKYHCICLKSKEHDACRGNVARTYGKLQDERADDTVHVNAVHELYQLAVCLSPFEPPPLLPAWIHPTICSWTPYTTAAQTLCCVCAFPFVKTNYQILCTDSWMTEKDCLKKNKICNQISYL